MLHTCKLSRPSQKTGWKLTMHKRATRLTPPFNQSPKNRRSIILEFRKFKVQNCRLTLWLSRKNVHFNFYNKVTPRSVARLLKLFCPYLVLFEHKTGKFGTSDGFGEIALAQSNKDFIKSKNVPKIPSNHNIDPIGESLENCPRIFRQITTLLYCLEKCVIFTFYGRSYR